MDCSRSRRNLFLTAVAAVPFIAAGLGAARGSRVPAPPVPPVIATIDLGAVVDGLDERKAMKAAFEKKKDEFKTSLDAKEKAIKDDQARYDLMPAGAPKKELGQKVVREALQYRFDKEYAGQFLDQMEGEGLRDLAERVSAACAALAKANHYTIVMADDSERKIDPGAAKDVTQQILLKHLWYVDPAHDVTKELIDFMNNQFAAAPKGP